jgi:sn-glycerol 3-phosphate transport system permease protein
VLCTLAGYAFARFASPDGGSAFLLVLVQLMIMPDVLIVENYRTMSRSAARHARPSGCPTWPRRFGIFLLRQTFKTVPKRAGRGGARRGCGPLEVLWKVYVPLARPVYIAYGAGLDQLPLEQLPLAADRHQLRAVAAADRGAAGVLVGRSGRGLVDHHGGDADDVGPLLIAFLLFQRQFVQSFMRAGIR